MVCAFFTWGLILYAEYVVLRVILLPDIVAKQSLYAVVNLLLFQALTALAVSSHVKTMLTDPVRHLVTRREMKHDTT